MLCGYGGSYDHQQTLVIQVVARTLARGSAITIGRIRLNPEDSRDGASQSHAALVTPCRRRLSTMGKEQLMGATQEGP